MSDRGAGGYGAKARSAYAEQTVMTASPERLVGMLFAGAAARLDRAQAAARAGNRAAAIEALSKAGAIVSELRATLDMERGGVVADDLFRLYGFVLDRLRKASSGRDPEAIGEASLVLAKLKEGWDGLVGGA
jgi:flagellar secretion chaperone FliS